ncbi:prolyl oligopeptidase [Botrytis cinerea]
MLFTMRSSLSLVALLSAGLANGTYTNSTPTFTPQAMLSSPRRGSAIPNADGTLALYTVATYSFEEHHNAHELRVMNLANGTSWLFSNSSGISNVNWLGDGSKIIWFVSEEDGSTSFVVGDATAPSAEPISAGSVPGAVDNLKLVSIGEGTLGVAFSGQALPNGTLYNSELAPTPYSTGRAYTKIFVRHWDTYVTPQRNSIWYAALSTTGNNYTLSEPINALNGSGLESPVPPFGATNSFDISSKGLSFIAKDITLNQATTTKSDVYYVPLTTFTETSPELKVISTPNLEGASDAVVFSPSGSSLAFVRMAHISYESDKNRVLQVADVTSDLTAIEFFASEDGKGAWDRSPSTLLYSQDGESIYAVAEDFARVRLFTFTSDPTNTTLPSIIFKDGGVTDLHYQGEDKLLISSSSYLDNSVFSSIDPIVSAATNASSGITTISANLNSLKAYGLSRDFISDVFYQGDGDYLVHAWIIKPSTFVEGQKYPLAFYIHGGPQGATEDLWSTRWNMAVFAEQGYVVVAFNPTGSTGFGQNITDGIQNQWGGRPYNDLVKGWEYIEENLSYVDTDRAIALGASYGGYMVNWIQGQPLGRKFKALFTHDGCFSTLAQYSSEELWFMQHDFNGTLWENFDNYARWNPANHTDAWSTPHLINHNELDYRLPIAEGLAAFNVLQAKGIESKFLSFPDENHWVLNQENSLVWHKTVIDWLNEHVGLPVYSSPDDTDYRAVLQNGPWI